MSSLTPPSPVSPRFTLELEFVLCLANPQYLSYLAVNFQNLLPQQSASTSTTTNNNDKASQQQNDPDSDSERFTRYLKYLYHYWRTPEYSKYLTHPGAVLRNLELLQQEQFRRDIIQPQTIARLFESGVNVTAADLGAQSEAEDAVITTDGDGIAGDVEVRDS